MEVRIKEMLSKRWVWLLLPALFALSACINEKPDFKTCRYKVGLRVHIDTRSLPDYIYDYTRAEDYRVQYILEVYSPDKDALVDEIILYGTTATEVLTADIEVPIGDYRIYAWASYCGEDAVKSLFYDTSDFNDISWKEPYEGNSNFKQAYTGYASFSLSEKMQLPADITVDVELQSPMARYQIIATDLMEFIAKGEPDEPEEDSYDGVVEFNETMSQTPNLSAFTVKVNYMGYLPRNFNVFSNNPFDSATGVSFEGGINTISSDQALLAFDYCMVNGEESSVSVALEIYDKNMNMVNETGTIEIPTRRNRTTIVYGKFLTIEGDGGIGIDPDFDGQYNIEYK